jgi:hypothetical protein
VPEPRSTTSTRFSTHLQPFSLARKATRARRPQGRLRWCRTIGLPRIIEPRGNLTFIEGGRHVPFDISRVYYVYDVPGGAERGGHAHKDLHEVLIALTGSFDVILDDGCDWKRVHLNRAFRGLYLPSMIWRELRNFSSGSVCLVLASAPFAESDYFREYSDFVCAVRSDV